MLKTPKQDNAQRAVNNELLTMSELAQFFKVHNRTIARMLRNGSLPQPIRIGSTRRWRRSDLETFLDKLQKAE